MDVYPVSSGNKQEQTGTNPDGRLNPTSDSNAQVAV